MIYRDLTRTWVSGLARFITLNQGGFAQVGSKVVAADFANWRTACFKFTKLAIDKVPLPN